MRLGILISVVMWLGVSALLTGCSFGVQIGYHGETGIDDREFTPKEPRK